MSTIESKIEAFAQLLEQQQRSRYIQEYPKSAKEAPMVVHNACRVTVRPGSKYVKVDVGTSGKYMVVVDTGEIFGIKAYGVIHREHKYGTLDTINEWDWSGYTAIPKHVDMPEPATVQEQVEAWEKSVRDNPPTRVF